MRTVADCLLAALSVLNLVLAAASRRDLPVAAAFAAAGALTGTGLLAASEPAVLAGLALSVIAPVLYGQRIADRNHLSHHLIRAVAVAAIAVLYGLS